MLKYEKIAQYIETQIKNGCLKPGSKVPSIRRTQRIFQCSPGTVLEAYRLLSDQRLIFSKPQSGFYVHKADYKKKVTKIPSPPSVTKPGFDTLLQNALESSTESQKIPFGVAAPGPDLIPLPGLEKAIHQSTKQNMSFLYSFIPGKDDLRIELTKKMFEQQIHCEERDILITTGCTRSIYLALQSSTVPGDLVAIESPYYSGYTLVLEGLGLKILEIPNAPNSPENLLQIFDAHKPKAFLSSAAFSNPLGYKRDKIDIKKIAEMCDSLKIQLIENDIFGDLYHSGERPRSYASYSNRVIYCSSFSKTLAPGLRVGWIVCKTPIAEAIQQQLKVQELASNTIIQNAVAQYLKTNRYYRHCRLLRKKSSEIKFLYTDIINKHFPNGTHIHECSGGLVLWIELPEECDSFKLQKLADQYNIAVAPGPLFSSSGLYKNFIRIGFGFGSSTRNLNGLVQLGKLISLQVNS